MAETQVEPKAEPKEEPPPDEGGLFQCYLCGMAERYHGHGFSVPFARAIVFNEGTVDCVFFHRHHWLLVLDTSTASRGRNLA